MSSLDGGRSSASATESRAANFHLAKMGAGQNLPGGQTAGFGPCFHLPGLNGCGSTQNGTWKPGETGTLTCGLLMGLF